MSRPCPMPGKMPVPDEENRRNMEAAGFKFIDESVTNIMRKDYIEYQLPPGWRCEDTSFSGDIRAFEFVDSENKIRWGVDGSWKGAYDCDLRLDTWNGEEFKPRSKTFKSGLTTTQAMAIVSMEALTGDPMDMDEYNKKVEEVRADNPNAYTAADVPSQKEILHAINWETDDRQNDSMDKEKMQELLRQRGIDMELPEDM